MIKRPALLLTVLLVIALIVVVTYKIQTDPFNNTASSEQNSEMMEEFGSIYSVYQHNCLTCHGRNGEGQSGFPSLQKTTFSVEEIKQIITTGRGEMPAFPHIKELQLSQLAEMVKQLSD
jgi:mono/diheme cytochrome c family protein